MSPYLYKPLQHHDSIRVLEIHPSSEESDPIICTLHHVRLSDADLVYKPISYTWGAATPQRPIFLDNGDGELLIGENCYNLVKRFRQHHQTHQYRLLWIDAICIDQSNLAERSSQVRLMDEIYDRASNVTVYLGEATPGSRILFEELVEAEKFEQPAAPNSREPPSDEVTRELDALLERPWFRRVWVLQEVCMKRSLTFMCGPDSASSRVMWECLSGYKSRVSRSRSFLSSALYLARYAPWRYSTLQFDLWHLLSRSRGCLATDPRDRVFALRSLLGPNRFLMDHLIDYTMATEDVYIKTAMFLLPVMGMHLLLGVRHGHNLNMPSWIPDWSQNLPLLEPMFNLDRFDRANHQSFDSKHRRHHYSIRPFSAETSSSIDRSLELVVTGRKYAQVLHKSQVFSFSDLYDAEVQMMKLYNTFPALKDVFPHGLHESDNMSDELGPEVLQAMSKLDGYTLHMWLSRKMIGSSWNEAMQITTPDLLTFFRSLQRCSIALLDNDELAILPTSGREGDTVCIFTGAESPCVLRAWRPDEGEEDGEDGTSSSSSSWKLVSGDCYIFTPHFACTDVSGTYLCDKHLYAFESEVEEFRVR